MASPPNVSNSSIVATTALLVIFLTIIVAIVYTAHKASRIDPVREVLRNRLAVLGPTRGLGSEALRKIPIITYHRDGATLANGDDQVPASRFQLTSAALGSLFSWFRSTHGMRYILLHIWKSSAGERETVGMESLSSCSICTEEFSNGVELRKLPCGHIYHPACIDPWLRDRARTCPLWYGI